jgi:transcriptional regulator with XRE-family HTH domain
VTTTSDPTDQSDAGPPSKRESDKAISRAIGEELRRAREAKNLTRIQLVAQLPSGIGDRTLLSYEHGARHLSVIRLIEIARIFDIPAPTLLTAALQRAQTELANLAIKVDLQALLNDDNDKFRPMAQWAKNKLNKTPDGVTELAPSSIKELADFVGYTYQDLAKHLARFAPEEDSIDGGNSPDTHTDSDARTPINETKR